MQATLLLDDGTRIPGFAAGAPGVAVGNLSVYAGHDSIHRLTDPASSGQICAFTQPCAGTWGINTEHCETGSPWMRGLIARDFCNTPSNWRSAETLDFYLRRNLLPAVGGIDVPALAKLAAERQVKRCAVVTSSGFEGWDALLAQVKAYRLDNTFPAAVKTPTAYGSLRNAVAHVAVCDFGSSRSLTRMLNAMRVRVTLLPPYDTAGIFQRERYDGLIIPNGAGTPRSHPAVTEEVRELLGAGVPTLGAGLGFHFIGAALGVRFKPLDEPHRGAWVPVNDVKTGKLLYTWQLHDLTPDEETLPPGVRITHRNAADGTVEGFEAEGKPVFAAHFLPCSDPRLGGTGEMLSAFFSLMKGDRS